MDITVSNSLTIIHCKTHQLSATMSGNPVSTMVTYKLFVLPALKSWHGEDPVPQTIRMAVSESRGLDPRPEYIRSGKSI